MSIEALAAEIDRLVETDPSVLADSESVLALHRQLSRLEAVAARATAKWDADRVWEAEKARSGPAFCKAMAYWQQRAILIRANRLRQAARSAPLRSGQDLEGSLAFQRLARSHLGERGR